MATFSANIQELEQLYVQHAEELFALCFLHTGRSGDAFSLMRLALCDMAYSERQWALAVSGRTGFLRAVHKSCMDYYVKNPRGAKRKKKKQDRSSQDSLRAALPFSMTDSLRALLGLPVKFKTPLYLLLAENWSSLDVSQVVGGSPAHAEALAAAALKKLDMPREKAAKLLANLQAGEDTLQRVWDRFLVDRDEKGFDGKQRLRRFKRGLDNAIPYIALGVVALGVVAFFGVEYGWFNGAAYEPAATIEGYVASGHYGNDPQSSQAETPKGDVSVYVPENGKFAQYVVRGTPKSPSAVARQMVALGGLPEGVSVVSQQLSGTDSASLHLEFSQEAADYFAAAEPGEGEAMLQAMTGTFAGLYGGLDQISLQSGGAELTANGKTAQELLNNKLEVSRTVETDYRE